MPLPPTKLAMQKAAARIVEQYVRVHDEGTGAWEDVLARLLDQLLREYPGFSTREYRTALNTRAAAKLRSRSRTRTG